MQANSSQPAPHPAQRREALAAILRKKWGYDSFRPLQLDIIESLLDGNDTIGLMPTGGGKSITFQVPALYAEGMALVITPLISLMKDQTDGLRRRRIRSVYFHSGMTSADLRIGWEALINGKAKFLYCSPERLKNARFCEELKHLNINSIVIDEAHCISQWGYDFRPDYLNISNLRKILPGVKMLALTATATPIVVEDIKRQLGMESPKVFVKSFKRENLSYVVRHTDSKDAEMLHILRNTDGSSIVYVRSRRRTVDIARWLSDHGVSALPYHAGLPFEKKEEHQDKWMRSEVRVMVATNAFGMGIDKANVRLVVHYDFPSSPEEYYQEAGRAGRDGLPSFAVLLANKRDKQTLRRRIENTFPPRPDIKQLYETVCVYLGIGMGEGYNRLYEFEPEELCSRFRLKPEFVRASLSILGNSGYMTLIDDADMRSRAMLAITREELYDIHVSPEAERVLTRMLRLYTGIFTDLVPIDELKLGNELRMDTRAVYEALIELRRAHIISYIPRRRVPYIYLPTAREEKKYVRIPLEVYEKRREQMAVRIEAMLDYAFDNTSCRVGRILDYFGEKNSGDCGKCDVCRSRSKRNSSRPTIEEAAAWLGHRIEGAGCGLPIREATEVPGDYRELVREAARVLLTQRIIREEGGRYFMVSKEE